MTHTTETTDKRHAGHPSFQGCPLITEKKSHPLTGWEWLRIPGLLMMTVGTLGLICGYSKEAAELFPLKFPPVWSCWILVGGGLIFRIFSAVSVRIHLKELSDLPPQDKWRSI